MAMPRFYFEFSPHPEIDQAVRNLLQFGPSKWDITFGAGGKDGDPNSESARKATMDSIVHIGRADPDTPIVLHLPKNRFNPLLARKFYEEIKKEDLHIMVMSGDGRNRFPDGYPDVADLVSDWSKFHHEEPGQTNFLPISITFDPHTADGIEKLMKRVVAVPEERREMADVTTVNMNYAYDLRTILEGYDRAQAALTKPNVKVIPGVMPVRRALLNERDQFGVPVPFSVREAFAGVEDRAEQRRIGKEITVGIIRDLAKAGIKDMQLFACNVGRGEEGAGFVAEALEEALYRATPGDTYRQEGGGRIMPGPGRLGSPHQN